jgi:hypothetical protein
MKKRILFCVFSLVLLSAFIAYVNALETVTVSPFGQMIRTLNLNEGDSVNGSISVNPAGLGGFYVLGPEQKSVLVTFSPMNSQPIPFSFSADVSGSYTIRFDSFDMLRSTTVTLDYTVHSSFSGLLQGDYVLPVFVVLLLLGFGIALILYIRAKEKNSHKDKEGTNSTQPSQIRCGTCGTLNDFDALYCKKCGRQFR